MEDLGRLPMFPWPATMFFLILVGFCSFTYTLLKFQSKHTNKYNPQPPGPRGLPIIGHLHMLGDLPHRSLHRLSQEYGPIMQLKLGLVPTVVVSSPEAAELFLKTHDINFANRPKIQAPQYLSYGGKGIAFSKYGSYWRNMRRLCTVHLLNTSKVDSFMNLRKEVVMDFVRRLKGVAEGGEVVNINEEVGLVIEKITCGMIFGRGFKEEFSFKSCVGEMFWLSGAFNLADYIPFFKAFDLQNFMAEVTAAPHDIGGTSYDTAGENHHFEPVTVPWLVPGLNRRMKDASRIMDNFQEKILHEHEENVNDQKKSHKDFIDVMLSLMKSNNANEEKLDRTIIKAITLDMLTASTDTATTTIEWALAELLRHPRVMRHVQEELSTAVGLDRMVEESDLGKLVYLDMVVKETMRLHPAVPLLVPRESVENISVGGYYIPKKSRIIVNAWAIGRDPNVWFDNVEEFYPERFVDNDIDVQGHDFQLIPFGSGRRKCPGMELGMRTIHFVLAQLLHCFKLELPDGISSNDVDMKEKSGLTMPIANPLLVVPNYRLDANNI